MSEDALLLLVCAPLWAATAAYALSALWLVFSPLERHTWADSTGAVVSLALVAALAAEVAVAVWAV